jgi:hypothetical protein
MDLPCGFLRGLAHLLPLMAHLMSNANQNMVPVSSSGLAA